MEVLCLGDIAIAEGEIPPWTFPPVITLGGEVRIVSNWELPVGNRINPSPRSSGPRLIAHPDSPRVLQKWSPGFATLATNHILDAGAEGLANTIEALNQIGFTTVGAGRTHEEIRRPLYWATDEGRLAIINWVFPETHPDWQAMPGPNCWPGTEEAKKAVAQAKDEADWVVVVVHWSDEFFPYPRPEDRAIASELAQMGVDMVIGHHPHVVRGMEVIGSCPVFYSIGNFYFSDFPDDHGGWTVREAPRNREGLGVHILFRKGEKPRYRLFSFWKERWQSFPDPLHRAARRIRIVSQPLQRYQGAEYDDWYADKRVRFDRWGYRWHFRMRQLGIHGSIRYLAQRLHAR